MVYSVGSCVEWLKSNLVIDMKKNKPKKLLSSAEALQLKRNIAEDAVSEYQKALLEADFAEALEFWHKKARVNFEDRGTISNYCGYIQDLLKQGLLSHTKRKKTFCVFELNDFYQEIIERINNFENFKLNDRRYRIKALLAFTKFLCEETDGKVKKLSAPPMITPTDEPLPEWTDESSKPQVLTKEEFEHLCEKIKSPKQRDYSSFRDYLVIEMMYQTARPLLDILILQKTDIDLKNDSVQFPNKPGRLVSVPITTKLKYGLESYLQYSQSYRKDEMLFVTREGNPIFRTHFYQVLKQASETADLGFVVTFKMIQWSLVAERMKKDKTPQKIMEELKLKKIPNKLELE